MNKTLFFLSIAAACLLQSTLFNSFRLFGTKPDLLLIALMLGFLRFERRWAFVFGVSAGFFKDAFAAHPFGIYTALFCFWVWALSELSRKITFDHPVVMLVLIGIMSAAGNVIAGCAVFLFNHAGASAGIFTRVVLLETLYTVAAAFLLQKLIEKAPSRLRPFLRRFRRKRAAAEA